jgi:hypothetical protein
MQNLLQTYPVWATQDSYNGMEMLEIVTWLLRETRRGQTYHPRMESFKILEQKP